MEKLQLATKEQVTTIVQHETRALLQAQTQEITNLVQGQTKTMRTTVETESKGLENFITKANQGIMTHTDKTLRQVNERPPLTWCQTISKVLCGRGLDFVILLSFF